MSCRELFMHEIAWALIFALLNAGNNNEARIAMMAITTRSSISVKARRVFDGDLIRSNPASPVQLGVFFGILCFKINKGAKNGEKFISGIMDSLKPGAERRIHLVLLSVV